MQYDTSEVDDILGGAVESAPRGYTEALAQIRDRIERNLAIMLDFGNSLKASAPSRYEAYMKDYNSLVATYNKNIEISVKAQYSAPADQNKCLNTMNSMLAYTDNAISQLKNAPKSTIAEQDVSKEGVPVTAMVKHSDSPEIVMENVGPLRAFWDGLNPTVRLISKAFVIGGILYGLKKGYDYLNPPQAAARTPNPIRRRRRRRPNPKIEIDEE